MNQVDLDNTINTISNSLWSLIEFSNTVTVNHQAKDKIELVFKDAIRKILEEVREYSFAVTEKQGEPEQHTRPRCVEEGFDVLFAGLMSHSLLNTTKQEVHDAVEVIVTNFNVKGWLD